MKRYVSIRVWKDGKEISGVRTLSYTEELVDHRDPNSDVKFEVRFETTDAIETTCRAASAEIEVKHLELPMEASK